MCGIVGYIGEKQAAPILLAGLEKLEYRGYDSAGIYVDNDRQEDRLIKEKGRVQALVDKVNENVPEGTFGIAHTRWATHGGVTVENAHPHFSDDERFYITHNGVIENYQELAKEYLSDIKLHSQTDTEVAVQLVAKFAAEGLDTISAFRKMINLLDQQSAYAFLMKDSQSPELMYIAKQKSPLLVGVGENENIVTSDASAMLAITHDFIELLDGETAIISSNKVEIFDHDGNDVVRKPFHLDIDEADTDKGIYPYYMIKEIDEQASVVRKLSGHYFNEDGTINNQELDPKIIEALKDADRLYIIAAGTSYHSGLVGKELFEKWSGKPAEAFVASEFAYNQPLLSKKPFFIFISQSGETADSREVLQNIKNQKFPTLTLANVMNSTLTREADFALPLLAGPEIAVASTKAYIAQITMQSILAFALAQAEGKEVLNLHEELAKIAVDMDSVINDKDKIKKIADDLLVPSNVNRAFFIGRGLDASLSLEAALKLKEVSYIQTEGFASGELKHGTISLIEEGTPVFGIITQGNTAGLTRSNLAETAARGGKTITIASEKYAKEGDEIVLPQTSDELAPMLAVVVAQLLAYYASVGKGLDVDRPRNLAKSITVQ